MNHVGRDSEGWYYVPAAGGKNTYMRTPLCPIDSMSKQTWADTMIQRVEDATTRGFGLCYDGTEYDLDNFLADNLIGNMPWDFDECQAFMGLIAMQPKYEQVMQAFYDKYGKEFMPVTVAGMHRLMAEEAGIHKQNQE